MCVLSGKPAVPTPHRAVTRGPRHCQVCAAEIYSMSYWGQSPVPGLMNWTSTSKSSLSPKGLVQREIWGWERMEREESLATCFTFHRKELLTIFPTCKVSWSSLTVCIQHTQGHDKLQLSCPDNTYLNFNIILITNLGNVLDVGAHSKCSSNPGAPCPGLSVPNNWDF